MKYAGNPKINAINGINENIVIQRARNNMAVDSGDVARFVTGEIKLSVLKLYEVNGNVKIVADIVTIKEDTIIFKDFIKNLNLLMLFNFDIILLFKSAVETIPKVAANES